MTRVGAVAIGRNEGERLVRCLETLKQAPFDRVVYVDSGSLDGSLERARELGVRAVAIDPPFTAARGRNRGLEELCSELEGLDFVQFVDGDCELDPGWLETAVTFLEAHRDVAVVCGRRRERFPDASPYNRLADMEWDTPVGDAEACGGDALMRADALLAVGGYDASLIAGEDPELCLRLRRQGHRIMRLDTEMTRHDAALESGAQWWRRAVRAGYACAQAVARHGGGHECYRVRALLSILFWGAGLPAATLLAVPLTRGWSLAALPLAFGLLSLRVARHRRARGDRRAHALLYGAACAVGKLAEFEGALRYAWRRWIRRERGGLIEYKQPR